MFEIKKLETEEDALRIIDFLHSDRAFEHTWAPGEKEMIREAVLASLKKEGHHQYWYVEEKGEIIGALGINENVYSNRKSKCHIS